MKFFNARFKKRYLSLLNENRDSIEKIPLPWLLLTEHSGDVGSTQNDAITKAEAVAHHLSRHPSRSTLFRLVGYIMEYKSGRREVDDEAAVVLFKMICTHPAKSDLILYPDDYFDHPPSVADVVEKSISQ